VEANERLTTFGRSFIDALANKSFWLGVRPDNIDDAGSIDVRCFPSEGGYLTIFGPPHYTVRFATEQVVTIWSDHASPMDIRLVGQEGLIGVATSHTPGARHLAGGPDAALATVTVIASARSFVAYSFAGKTAMVASPHLSAAWHRFRELCREVALP
jgi:hypothetical protein